jgi:hypothetical protein
MRLSLPRVGEGVLAIAHLSCAFAADQVLKFCKDCFGVDAETSTRDACATPDSDLGPLTSDRLSHGRGDGVGRGLGVICGRPGGVGEHGPCPSHQVKLTVSTRQPSFEPLVSLAIRQRSLIVWS